VNVFEIEFCKECGQEFPYGIEKTCPICGYSDDPEHDLRYDPAFDGDFDDDILTVHEFDKTIAVCGICKNRCTPSDQRFEEYWINFDGPRWFRNYNDLCVDCFINNFERNHPDFDISGLAPDTFLVWKDALDSGVDLGPKLFDIESTNAIRRLLDCSLSRNDMIRWLNTDCPVDEAAQWATLFDDVDEAMAWHGTGFSPDENSTGSWLKWGCTPQIASEFVQKGFRTGASIRFKELGFKLEDALFYKTQEFPGDTDDFEQYLKLWRPSGFSSAQIMSLRDQLLANAEVFEVLHVSSQLRLNNNDRTNCCWDALPRNFESLKQVGLPITAPNLERYWGLSSSEILEVIDAGGKPGLAAEVIRHGGSIRHLVIIEKLLDLGTGYWLATLLTQRGFLLKHFKDAVKKGDVLSTLMKIGAILKSDSRMKIDDAYAWFEIEGSFEQLELWKMQGFAPHEGINWSKEGFEPETARKWRDAGVDSPVTAKRRRDAGLQP
jgi:hypothetical protein